MDKRILIGGAVLLFILANSKKKPVRTPIVITTADELDSVVPDRTVGGILGYYVDREG